MYTPRTTRIPSALGAIFAATLLTLVTAVPDAVHAQGMTTAAKPFTPIYQ